MLGRRCWRTTSTKLEQPTPPKLPAPKAQACDDDARNAAAATDDKPARSWAKHTIRQTNTSCRLTLELSGGAAVRLERLVRWCTDKTAAHRFLGGLFFADSIARSLLTRSRVI